MPDGSDVTNCGFLHVLEPEVTGGVVAAFEGEPDGAVELLGGAAELPGLVACCVPDFRGVGAESGMTAIWGAAAI